MEANRLYHRVSVNLLPLQYLRPYQQRVQPSLCLRLHLRLPLNLLLLVCPSAFFHAAPSQTQVLRSPRHPRAPQSTLLKRPPPNLRRPRLLDLPNSLIHGHHKSFVLPVAFPQEPRLPQPRPGRPGRPGRLLRPRHRQQTFGRALRSPRGSPRMVKPSRRERRNPRRHTLHWTTALILTRSRRTPS